MSMESTSNKSTMTVRGSCEARANSADLDAVAVRGRGASYAAHAAADMGCPAVLLGLHKAWDLGCDLRRSTGARSKRGK
jgi:hypothetical protein